MTITRLETCSNNCSLNLKLDRAHGLIYGPFSDGTRQPDGTLKLISSSQHAANTGTCTYCSALLPAQQIERLKQQLSTRNP